MKFTKENLWNFITEYFSENLFFPSYLEISDEFRTNTDRVTKFMRQLENDGLVVQQYRGGRWRLNNYDLRRLAIDNVLMYDSELEEVV